MIGRAFERLLLAVAIGVAPLLAFLALVVGAAHERCEGGDSLRIQFWRQASNDAEENRVGEMYKLVRVEKEQSFFKRHDRSLTFLGALIVFTTFVAKEGIKETLKDRTTAVDSAIQRAAIRDEIAEVEASNTRIKVELNSVRDRVYSIKPTGRDKYGPDWTGMDHENGVLAFVGRDMDRCEEVARSLSEKDRFLAEIKKVRDRQWTVSGEVHQVEIWLDDKTKPGSVNERLWEKDQRRIRNEYKEAVSHVEGLRNASDSTSSEIMYTAQETKESGERSLRRWTLISYGLYTIGWGLGLAGRLFGDEDLFGVD